MAKSHRHHRRRNPRRRSSLSRRRRSNGISYQARRRNPRVRHHRRRRNPSFMNNQLFGLAGGAIVAGIGCRVIPQMVASGYNSGWTGYGLDAATGFVISRFGLRHINREWETGGYVGTILSVASRIVSEKFGSTIFGNGAGVSGDLAFDMGYYMDESFPWRGNSSMGPYPQYPGGRYALPAPVPTAATAVQAGQAAAASVQAAGVASPASGSWRSKGAGWR